MKLTRNDVAPAVYRPGMYTGPKGTRKQHEWIADAVVEYLNLKLDKLD